MVKVASARTIRRRTATARDDHAELGQHQAAADAIPIGLEVVDEDRTEPGGRAAGALTAFDGEELEAPTARELAAALAENLEAVDAPTVGQRPEVTARGTMAG